MQPHEHCSTDCVSTSYSTFVLYLDCGYILFKKGTRPLVFICHSSKDKVFVKKLAADLRKQEIDVWLDEWNMNVGDSIHKK
jgi:esterase/lipase superfamily enzyme